MLAVPMPGTRPMPAACNQCAWGVLPQAWPPHQATRACCLRADWAAGSKYAFDELLPRWLASMSPTLDGNIAKHTILLTLGYTAHELCRAEQESYRHQCVLLPHWTGPDRMYHFGDDWYTGMRLTLHVMI